MAKRKKKEEDLAAPQQKATPVSPPEDGGAKRVASPMTFFNDPRMDASKGGVRNFAPAPSRIEPGSEAGNEKSPSPEGDG